MPNNFMHARAQHELSSYWIVYIMCAERDWKINVCRPSTTMVPMLGSFSARDKIIQRSVNTIARDECSMAIESQRNILLSLLCMKKKTVERRV